MAYMIALIFKKWKMNNVFDCIYNKMNYIEKIVNLIIRPTRDQYHMKRLGDPQMTIHSEQGQSITVHRQDRIILNKHNEHLHLSYYEIQSIQIFNRTQQTHNLNPNPYRYSTFTENQQPTHPSTQFYARSGNKLTNFKNKCVIYLHANNGSRIQGMAYLNKLLQAHCNVCLFDCSGSGSSQGNFVTLGLKQSRDLDSVVNYLVRQKKITHISLWGRSMGASTAIIYGSKRSQAKISGMVLDSPFKDLQKLILQIASDKTGLPKMFFKPLLPLVRAEILSKTGYNISELKLKRYIQKNAKEQSSANEIETISSETNDWTGKNIERNPLSNIAALFVVSKNDKFVKCHHGQKLFRRYLCSDKELHYVQAEHHESRPQKDVDKIINFIVNQFNLTEARSVEENKKQPLQFSKNVFHRSKVTPNRMFEKCQDVPFCGHQKSFREKDTFVMPANSFKLRQVQQKINKTFSSSLQSHFRSSSISKCFTSKNQENFNKNSHIPAHSNLQFSQKQFQSRDLNSYYIPKINHTSDISKNYLNHSTQYLCSDSRLLKFEKERVLTHQSSHESFSTHKKQVQASIHRQSPAKYNQVPSFNTERFISSRRKNISFTRNSAGGSYIETQNGKISLSSMLAAQQTAKNKDMHNRSFQLQLDRNLAYSQGRSKEMMQNYSDWLNKTPQRKENLIYQQPQDKNYKHLKFKYSNQHQAIEIHPHKIDQFRKPHMTQINPKSSNSFDSDVDMHRSFIHQNDNKLPQKIKNQDSNISYTNDFKSYHRKQKSDISNRSDRKVQPIFQSAIFNPNLKSEPSSEARYTYQQHRPTFSPNENFKGMMEFNRKLQF